MGGQDGVVNVSAKLSPHVDECPVDGNLLSGIALVSCKIRLRDDAYPVVEASDLDDFVVDNGTNSISRKVALQCGTPGCTANASMIFGPTIVNSKACTMSVRIWQTDFDGDSKGTEEVEWVKVNDANVTESTSPGKNPCKENATQDMFVLVDGEDVDISSGRLDVWIKISNMVDECGHDGWLLDAEVEVNCTDDYSDDDDGSAPETSSGTTLIPTDNVTTVPQTPKVETGKVTTVPPTPKVETGTTSTDKVTTVPPTPKVDDQVTTVQPTPKVDDQMTTVQPTPKVDDQMTTVQPTPKVDDQMTTVQPTPKVDDQVTTVQPTPKVETGTTSMPIAKTTDAEGSDDVAETDDADADESTEEDESEQTD